MRTSPPPLSVKRALRDVGSNVATWRKLRGLTQQNVAERAGIARGTVARLERGDGTVSLDLTLRILHALGLVDDIAPAIDPYETDVGRLRSDERLPERVRHRKVGTP